MSVQKLPESKPFPPCVVVTTTDDGNGVACCLKHNNIQTTTEVFEHVVALHTAINQFLGNNVLLQKQTIQDAIEKAEKK